MTIENSIELQYPDFQYSLNASKLLGTKEDDLDILLKVYNVTHKQLEEMISSIREWYKKQPHLPQGQLHDRMIIGHLITRGFSVEQSKEKIDGYFGARNRMPDILCGWEPLPTNSGKYLKEGYWTILPYRTPENHRIIIFRILSPEMVFMDMLRVAFLMGDYRVFNETTVGDHWILDFTNSTINHALQLNPILLNKVYYHVTSCYALKIKGIHLVNIPSFGYSILALVKKILKSKHVSRIHLYESFEMLYNVLPRDVFPKDLGGTSNLTCQDISDTWHDTLTSDTWRKFFENEQKTFFTDESIRPTASKLYDTFGVEGTFKKLQLD